MAAISSLLTDAQEMARKHPDTFEAPTLDELVAIAPGDSVKICVTAARERFWTLVESVQGDMIHATVDNHLDGLDWPPGKMLVFERKHVYPDQTCWRARAHPLGGDPRLPPWVKHNSNLRLAIGDGRNLNVVDKEGARESRIQLQDGAYAISIWSPSVF